MLREKCRNLSATLYGKSVRDACTPKRTAFGLEIFAVDCVGTVLCCAMHRDDSAYRHVWGYVYYKQRCDRADERYVKCYTFVIPSATYARVFVLYYAKCDVNLCIEYYA